MRPSHPLALEQLEDRCVPATFGNPWPDGANLTLSFAPDGTPVGTSTSSLFRLLNGSMPTQVWQQAVVRAFQAWAESRLDPGFSASQLATIRRVIPPGSCVLADQVSYLVAVDRFTSDVPGCSQMIDGLGIPRDDALALIETLLELGALRFV